MGRTLIDKIWDMHRISTLPDGRDLVHIDRHLIHEVTSPIAFAKLREAGRTVRNPELTFATIDHIVSTRPGRTGETYARGAAFVQALRRETAAAGIKLFDLDSDAQGIVHVISPELGLALPGLTMVCGDSHTCTLGGLGALAFGIGSSEIEQVLATQCLALHRPRTLRIHVDGMLPHAVTAKDLILAIVAQVGARGGVGHAVEYAGSAIRTLSVEERLTICNMTIELGSRIGLIAPDETVFSFLRGRDYAPSGAAFDRAISEWRGLCSDEDADFDREVRLRGDEIAPTVTWGTSPDQTAPIDGVVPDPGTMTTSDQSAATAALRYMDLQPGMPLDGVPVTRVFIGSCTNGRLSDLRAAAALLEGRHVHKGVRTLVVPGSMRVKRLAETEGLDRIFTTAGAEWREPGCSMCCALQDDSLSPGERCASTSNRNFEGRQGAGGRTHLMSPAMAAAAAVAGAITDARAYPPKGRLAECGGT
ncbi:MAG: 3-isopropylmalate dehydratase large subunit [Pseudomonadota bacterium]